MLDVAAAPGERAGEEELVRERAAEAVRDEDGRAAPAEAARPDEAPEVAEVAAADGWPRGATA